jgi:integrase
MRGGTSRLPPVGDHVKAEVQGADFEGIGFHSLGHPFNPSTMLGRVRAKWAPLPNGSNLARSGADDRTIHHFMGHQTEEMRRRYQHLFLEEKRKALSRLGY